MKKIFSFLTKKKPTAPLFEIVFHSDRPDYGTHGFLQAECRQRGIMAPKDVRFCFVGLTKPPVLTIEILTALFEEAANQGYVVHCLKTYGLTARISQPANIASVISDARRAAEEGAHKRQTLYVQPSEPVKPKETVATHIPRDTNSQATDLALANFMLPKKIQAPQQNNTSKVTHAPVHSV